MKVLITGANGQLGRELSAQLGAMAMGCEVFLTTKQTLDVSDQKEVAEQFLAIHPDVVINCAAFTAVDLCEDEPEKAFAVNAMGAKNVAVMSDVVGATLIHLSTDYVFDGKAGVAYGEEAEPNPMSVYGRSKLAGERFVAYYQPRHFIVRTAWLFGEGKNFVRTMIRLAESNAVIRVVNDQFGSPTSTKEVAKAILLLLDSERFGIYHATCDGVCSWFDFAVKIFELTGSEVVVEPCSSEEFPQKAVRPRFSVLETTRFKQFFGHSFLPWEKALEDYLQL